MLFMYVNIYIYVSLQQYKDIKDLKFLITEQDFKWRPKPVYAWYAILIYLIIFLAGALVDEVMYVLWTLSLWVIIHITNHLSAL